MRDYNNYKPYRTKAQKAVARATAKKVNGTWVSNAPRSFHARKEKTCSTMRLSNEVMSQSRLLFIGEQNARQSAHQTEG